MVEVVHDVVHPQPLLPDQVLPRHLDVVELDERRPRADLARDLDSAQRHARVSLQRHDEQRDAFWSRAGAPRAYSHGRVVGEDAIGDPLLGAVDDVVLAVGGRLGGGDDVGYVGAGLGLGDGDTGALAAQEEVGEEALLELLAAVAEDWGHAESHARGERARGASEAGLAHLRTRFMSAEAFLESTGSIFHGYDVPHPRR